MLGNAWVRRGLVMVLFGLAGVLVMGPSVQAISFLGPVVTLLCLRAIWPPLRETIAFSARQRGIVPAPTTPQLPKRGYAILATILVACLSFPLWVLCSRDAIFAAVTLIPALVFIWLGTWFVRGT